MLQRSAVLLDGTVKVTNPLLLKRAYEMSGAAIRALSNNFSLCLTHLGFITYSGQRSGDLKRVFTSVRAESPGESGQNYGGAQQQQVCLQDLHDRVFP